MLLKDKDLVANMCIDELTAIIRQDAILCLYGMYYVNWCRLLKTGQPIYLPKNKGTRRFLKETMQMKPEVKSAKDPINPKFFDVVIKGVKAFFVFIDDLQEFEIPSLARKMGPWAKKNG